MRATTSDGIPAEAWDRIHDLSLQYANSVTAGRRVLAESVRKQILRALNGLESKFGRRPSILATKGEYVRRPSDRQRLLLAAFSSAMRRGDAKNVTLISSSLAEFYADEVKDSQQVKKWITQLERALAVHPDRTEAAVFRSLKRRFR